MKAKYPLRSEFARLSARKRWGNITPEEVSRMSELATLFAIERKRPIEERFWEKVQIGDADSCWPWKAHRDDKNYGGFMLHGKAEKAHRVAYSLKCGPIPKGQYVCHSCDNPPCCNPNHLFLGTAGDNTRDSVHKGRFVSSKKGETHCNAKFTNEQILELRNQHKKGAKIRALARQNGVVKSTMGSIIHRLTWKHI